MYKYGPTVNTERINRSWCYTSAQPLVYLENAFPYAYTGQTDRSLDTVVKSLQVCLAVSSLC